MHLWVLSGSKIRTRLLSFTRTYRHQMLVSHMSQKIEDTSTDGAHEIMKDNRFEGSTLIFTAAISA